MSKLGGVLIQGMNKVIAESKDDSKLRGLAYVAVGKLSRKIPSTISNDISVVHNFFNALQTEDADTKLNIQEALMLMIDAFRSCKREEKGLLLTLLFQYVENVSLAKISKTKIEKNSKFFLGSVTLSINGS